MWEREGCVVSDGWWTVQMSDNSTLDMGGGSERVTKFGKLLRNWTVQNTDIDL